jgi:hypothetical protein
VILPCPGENLAGSSCCDAIHRTHRMSAFLARLW